MLEKKKRRFQINNLIFHLKKLEIKEQTKLKAKQKEEKALKEKQKESWSCFIIIEYSRSA